MAGGRGRPPKPDHLRAIDGGAGQRPADKGTVGGGEKTMVAAVPARPDHLKGMAAEHWDLITPHLLEAGLVAEIFTGPLEAYCDAYGRWLAAKEQFKDSGAQLVIKTVNGYPMINPYLSIVQRERDRMVAYAGEFGMTPAALTRVTKIDQLDLFDPLTRLLAGGKGIAV